MMNKSHSLVISLPYLTYVCTIPQVEPETGLPYIHEITMEPSHLCWPSLASIMVVTLVPLVGRVSCWVINALWLFVFTRRWQLRTFNMELFP